MQPPAHQPAMVVSGVMHSCSEEWLTGMMQPAGLEHAVRARADLLVPAVGLLETPRMHIRDNENRDTGQSHRTALIYRSLQPMILTLQGLKLLLGLRCLCPCSSTLQTLLHTVGP